MAVQVQKTNACWASICDREYDEAVAFIFARVERDRRVVVAVERGSWFVLGFCGVGLCVVVASLPWLLA